jgi:hypothetical protein
VVLEVRPAGSEDSWHSGVNTGRPGFGARWLFEPGSRLTHEEAHKVWHEGARMFARQVKGSVKIFMKQVIPGSVFQEIELPTLLENPNAKVKFK